MTDIKQPAGDNPPATAEREIVRHKRYELIIPFERVKDGETVTELVIRRPKGKELREVEKMTGEVGAMQASYHMAAALTGLTVDDIDEMDGEDVINLSELVADFLPKRATGEQ